MLTQWFILILLSACVLAFYDICKKHAVNENSVMPVLFLATACGTTFYVLVSLCTGTLWTDVQCTPSQFGFLALKALIVASSWTLGYYGVRDLPISLSTPIRASAPFWTFLGGLLLYHEVPGILQGLAMLFIFAGYYAFSVIGKLEGFTFRHRGIILMIFSTLLGAGSALYDKYLLNVIRIPKGSLQFYFSVDLVVILGLALLTRHCCFRKGRPFVWKWSIPLTGVLLIVADFLYFYAVSLPDIHISVLSLVRRSSCVLTFAVGAKYFHDKNVWKKAAALAAILTGIVILALAK